MHLAIELLDKLAPAMVTSRSEQGLPERASGMAQALQFARPPHRHASHARRVTKERPGRLVPRALLARRDSPEHVDLKGICPKYCAIDGGVFFEDGTRR
uniref:Uncharacterized protein n=1 Tax=Globodera rostochiensis TaxID=31243 RepID=A0A914HRS0_GLORO